MDVYELRRNDYSLGEEQEAVQQSFREFFTQMCPSSVVRDAEPSGFDARLWKAAADMGAVSMAVPESAGGDGAALTDLCVVTEELGRALAPIPLIDQMVTLRALASAGAQDVVAAGLDGDRIMTTSLAPSAGEPRCLVPSGAVASDALMLHGDDLVLVPRNDSVEPVLNQGSVPLAWWDVPREAAGVVVARGERAHEIHGSARREWKILTSAALAGLSEAALALGLEFVRTRETMGVIIATLQGVSFPLTDVAITISGARNLTLRAAWFDDHEPGTRDELAAAAYAYASSTATHAVTVSAHVQGGLGFTIEADISLYFLRAKAWALLGGDPANDELAVGRTLVDAAIAGAPAGALTS